MIVVFGSVNADLFLNVPYLPKRGQTVLCPTYVFRPGGKGANQAVAAARAGAEVKMIGRVGTDPYAEPVRAALHQAGVDVNLIHHSETMTGIAAVMVEEGGENQIVVASGANLQANAEQIPEALLSRETTLVLQMEVSRTETEAAIWRARQAGCRIILNLAPVGDIDEAALRACDILVVNEGEAQGLAGVSDTPENHARRFAHYYALDSIITLGGSGAILATKSTLFRINALDIDPIDTVGAGDAFVGVLAASLDTGAQVPCALRQASVAAGLTCLHEGAQSGLPTMAEINAVIAQLDPAKPID